MTPLLHPRQVLKPSTPLLFSPLISLSQHTHHYTSPHPPHFKLLLQCLDEEKAVKDSARAVPSDTGRSFETTSSTYRVFFTVSNAPIILDPRLASGLVAMLTLQGYHQARHPSSRPSRRCQANLWSDLRRDPRRPQDLVSGSVSSPHHPTLMAASRTSSGTRSPTPNTPSERPSPRSTSSTP